MGFVQAWSTATGREQFVPEHFFDDPRLSRGLTREQPQADPQPTEDWTIAALREYAAAHDVDLAGATLKADVWAAVSAALPEPVEATPSVDEPIVDSTNNSNIETPVTGENQE